MNEVEIDIYCHMCKGRTSFRVSRDGFQAWRDGSLIQKALPELSKDQRELMISGTCPTCFDKLFGNEDDWK
jgi:hypothetical protein